MLYYTHYSIEDCIALLSRRNIYDVFVYSFEMKTETTGEIPIIHYFPITAQTLFHNVYMLEGWIW